MTSAFISASIMSFDLPLGAATKTSVFDVTVVVIGSTGGGLFVGDDVLLVVG